MTTNRAADAGRLTIAEAKRLILESSPRESFVQVYRRKDGTLQAVPDAVPKSIFAGHLDEDFAANCAQLGIVPRWKYRPGKTGYTGDPATDDLYTIASDELVQLVGLHGLTLKPELANTEPVAAAPWQVVVTEPLHASRWPAEVPMPGEHRRGVFPNNVNGPVGPTIAREEAARIAAGCFTINEASRVIGEIQGWNEQQVKTLREQMLDAARSGALVVRHPHTDLPVPLQQREKVGDFYELVTRDDVNAWLVSIGAPFRWVTYEQAAAEPRYIAGRRLWNLADACDTVAAIPGFGVAPAALLKRAAKAAAARALTLRDPEDGEARHGCNLSGFFVEYLYAEDFNAWLASAGFRESYRLPDESPSEAIRAAAEPVPASVSPGNVALSLTTGDMAFAFDGLRYTEAQWKKPLGNKPKWLQACVVAAGRRGVTETRWNPVLIGGALVNDGYAQARSVRARFQTHDLLKPWLDAWKTYEADYLDNP